MQRRLRFALATGLVMVWGAAGAQDFPAAIEGEIYLCPRIDLASDGGGNPLSIELDGELDEEAWERAYWEGWSVDANLNRGDPAIELLPEDDLEFEWAAVADLDFLYVAWRIRDETLQNMENFQCDAWRDDSVEVYIDALNDGPDCTTGNANCYNTDDAQITVGMENDGLDDPELLVVGGVAGGPNCDFSGPHPEICQGVVRQVLEGPDDAYAGWQAEIAIALETLGNNDDGTPEWAIEPNHCRSIGFNIHGQDDDLGGDRDTKLMWSKKEVVESAWRNPAIFGQLIFIDPTKPPEEECKPCPPPEGLTCTRNDDGSVSLSWSNHAECDPLSDILILVDNQQVTSVAGSETETMLTVEQVPFDQKDHVIALDNSGGQISRCVLVESAFDDCGGIRTWNILGAFQRTGGAAPGEGMIRADYLTDGQIDETEFIWFPGATIATDFGRAALSTGLESGLPDLGRNPGGVPTVFSRVGESARVFLESNEAFGRDINNVMNYGQVYIVAEEPREAFLEVSSDDSIQVLLNGEEVWINNLGRGGSSSCSPQDVPFEPIVLEEGYNSLMIKVFEGTGGHDFTVGLRDELGQPFSEGVVVALFPEGACPVPPVTAARSIDTGATIKIQHEEVPSYDLGATYDVSIALSDPRPESLDCSAAGDFVITETIPDGWTASMASHDGMIGGTTITWTVSAAALPLTLSYKVTTGDVPGNVRFRGSISEPGSIITFAIAGDSLLANPVGFSSEGFINQWLLLGPYAQPQRLAEPSANPGEDAMRRDHLTDGADINEIDVEPRGGDTVDTDYGGAARSTALTAGVGVDINPGGVPTWHEWRDEDDTIDFVDYYGARGIDNVMMYAVTYILVESEMSVDLGLGSDDAVQVLLDGEEIWINNIARFHDGANAVQDVVLAINTPALDGLSEGLHTIMVKVFEGGGDHAFRLRFQDSATGEPITEGITVCLVPDEGECGGIVGIAMIRADANNDGRVNIADAQYTLNRLFLGGPAHPCEAQADANADGRVNIADAQYELNALFLGGPAPPAPYPNCGRSDAAGDLSLGCAESSCR